MHLEIKSACERCGSELNPTAEAYICSYECTFCPTCASTMHGVCANCGGELVLRPKRNVQTVDTEWAPREASVRPRAWRIWALSFGLWGIVALITGITTYQLDLFLGHRMSWNVELILPLVNFCLYALLTPFIFFLSVRHPFLQDNWARRAAQYMIAALVFNCVQVGLRSLLYPVWDSRINDFAYALWNPHTGVWKFDWVLYQRLLLYNSVDNIVVGFVPIVLIAQAVAYYRKLRERESQALQLESQLAKARLQALKNQLQPHFLFNTMHSISSLMLTDVPAADKMMMRLSDLLRMSLESDGIQITTLSRELEFVNGYLEIEKIRFEDRLKVVMDVTPDTFDAQVPHLILQPLVENAVKHGVARLCDGGEIHISATHDERDLHLLVRDNGPGLSESAAIQANVGVGLRATRERLRTLYGDQQSIDLVTGPEQGVEVRVRIPFRTEDRPL